MNPQTMLPPQTPSSERQRLEIFRSLRGEILYYENDSNIVINDYNRTVAMLKLRYDYY